MFGNPHFDRVRQTFADQFLADGDEFIYRKGQNGAAIRVTEMERNAFVANFNKRLRYATWSIVPATIVLILALTLLMPDADSPQANIAVWIGIAVIVLPFLAVLFWAWNAPARELQHRAPEKPELTKREARELGFSTITYGQLAFVALVGAGLVWKNSTGTDVFHGESAIWLMMGGFLIALAGIQAVRKWLSSQHPPLERD